jgi:nitrogen fixation NifU-like protein
MGEMYTERLLDHYRRPRNKGHLESADTSSATAEVLAAREYNPLCGDEVAVQVLVEGGRIADARFEGRGCALCMGAASILTEAVQGRTLEKLASFGKDEYLEELGATVRPARLRCALLPWMAFRHAVFGEDDWSILDNGSDEQE